MGETLRDGSSCFRDAGAVNISSLPHVVFFGINSAKNFSGGRYHAWMIAEAAAEMGWPVSYITDNVPSFYDDFSDAALFPRHNALKIIKQPIRNDKGYAAPNIPCDILVVVPHGDSRPPFYGRAIQFARKRNARIMLLNFESANWFNALSPEPRDPARWDGWKEVSQCAAMIFSLGAEGTAWARDFYDTAPRTLLYDHLWPAINSRAADRIPALPKEKRILFLTRFAHAEHKGGNLVPEILCEAMRGYTVVFIVGVGAPDKAFLDPIKQKCKEYGITIEMLSCISEEEKWRQFKRASLVLFPSFFEGFGLPPVEAQYAGTPCIAFDLPILREVSGDGIVYVPAGDTAAMREKIAEILGSARDWSFLKDQFGPAATFDDFTLRVDCLLRRAYYEGQPASLFPAAL